MRLYGFPVNALYEPLKDSCTTKTNVFLSYPFAEYDRYLASSKTMAAAYLDPNLNHTPSSSAKSHLSSGLERSPGAMERVLKVFHYFENSSEPTTWASIIRHGDATDVRVSLVLTFSF